MPSTTDSINTTEEVYTSLLSLDLSTKTTGIDRINPPVVLKNCAIVLTKLLHYLFSYAIYSCLPSEWQIATLHHPYIFKAGKKNCVTNYSNGGSRVGHLGQMPPLQEIAYKIEIL